MIRRLITLALLGGLAISVAGCDKCGDYFRPKGPFDPVSCKSDPR